MTEPPPPRSSAAPVVVIGGGAIGLAIAWRLARRGLGVTLLERGELGAEASSHAGGILGAQTEAHEAGAAQRLALASRRAWPRFARELHADSGVDVELRGGGVLRVAFAPAELRALRDTHRRQQRLGLPARWLPPRELRALEPELSPQLLGGLWFERDRRVDPARLVQALATAALRRGVRVRTHTPARDIVCDGRVRGVTLESGARLRATQVVLAAGAWSCTLGGTGLEPGLVEPVRGQIVQLECASPPLGRVVFGPRCYLVPRDDGRVLIGSTEERVGFERGPTAGAQSALLRAALELLPSLAHARPGPTWVGFRPYSQRGAPLVGPAPIAGLYWATGHYRNGILLTPGTAAQLERLVLREHARPPGRAR